MNGLTGARKFSRKSKAYSHESALTAPSRDIKAFHGKNQGVFALWDCCAVLYTSLSSGTDEPKPMNKYIGECIGFIFVSR